MRKILLAIVAVVLLAPAAWAQGPIGVVDMAKIIKTCEPGQKALKELQGSFSGVKDDLDKQKASIEQMRQEMQKQSLVLSQEAKMDKEMEFKRKVRDFQDALRNYQRKVKAEEERLSEPVIKTIFEVMKDFGKKNGYAMILDGRGAGLLYVDDKADVTNQIIVEVNKASRKK
ncbi:outer membrane protein [Desulfobaculum xiamenense]|uniref:Outer membrane protein n=1 Tax=Desulfobaculum xiamenense TaxID=995050 RepID=A0A846QUR4_9BACT|nr:OmpH family outer membrane protein [Desulfobaculum xiamenense]NJB68874.1 outer membrane protein [Desulfobaculum xiamenense]